MKELIEEKESNYSQSLFQFFTNPPITKLKIIFTSLNIYHEYLLQNFTDNEELNDDKLAVTSYPLMKTSGNNLHLE